MTATPILDRPLPRSYMSEEDKLGMTQNAIYACESVEADLAGDKDAAWAWLALAKLPDGVEEILIKTCGADFLKSKGFNI